VNCLHRPEVLNLEFKERITQTEDQIRAEIHDVITGAKVNVTAHFGLLLFDDIMVKIETVDLATAKITASFVSKIDKEEDLGTTL
jgi:ribonuclease R